MCCHLAEVARKKMLAKSPAPTGHHASIWQVAHPVSHHGVGQIWLMALGEDDKGDGGDGGNCGMVASSAVSARLTVVRS
jgi:hypothetical protein